MRCVRQLIEESLSIAWPRRSNVIHMRDLSTAQLFVTDLKQGFYEALQLDLIECLHLRVTRVLVTMRYRHVTATALAFCSRGISQFSMSRFTLYFRALMQCSRKLK